MPVSVKDFYAKLAKPRREKSFLDDWAGSVDPASNLASGRASTVDEATQQADALKLPVGVPYNVPPPMIPAGEPAMAAPERQNGQIVGPGPYGLLRQSANEAQMADQDVQRAGAAFSNVPIAGPVLTGLQKMPIDVYSLGARLVGGDQEADTANQITQQLDAGANYGALGGTVSGLTELAPLAVGGPVGAALGGGIFANKAITTGRQHGLSGDGLAAYAAIHGIIGTAMGPVMKGILGASGESAIGSAISGGLESRVGQAVADQIGKISNHVITGSGDMLAMNTAASITDKVAGVDPTDWTPDQVVKLVGDSVLAGGLLTAAGKIADPAVSGYAKKKINQWMSELGKQPDLYGMDVEKTPQSTPQAPPPAQEPNNATSEGPQQQDVQQQHPGIPQGAEVSQNPPQVGQAGGDQAGGGGGLRSEAQKPLASAAVQGKVGEHVTDKNGNVGQIIDDGQGGKKIDWNPPGIGDTKEERLQEFVGRPAHRGMPPDQLSAKFDEAEKRLKAQEPVANGPAPDAQAHAKASEQGDTSFEFGENKPVEPPDQATFDALQSESHQARVKVWEDQRAAQAAARASLGSQSRIRRLENTGRDITAIPGYDEKVGQLAQAHPGHITDEQSAWELIKKDLGPKPRLGDQENLDAARAQLGPAEPTHLPPQHSTEVPDNMLGKGDLPQAPPTVEEHLSKLSGELGGSAVNEVEPSTPHHADAKALVNSFGNDAVFVDSEDKRWSAWTPRDGSNRVFLNANYDGNVSIATAAHELAHNLGIDQQFNQFDRQVIEEAADRYSKKAGNIEGLSDKLVGDKRLHEGVAQLVEDIASDDPERFKRLSRENPGLMDKIGELWQKLTGNWTPQDEATKKVLELFRQRFGEHQAAWDSRLAASGAFAIGDNKTYNLDDLAKYYQRNGLGDMPTRQKTTEDAISQEAIKRGIPDDAVAIATKALEAETPLLNGVEERGLSMALDKMQAAFDILRETPSDDPAHAPYIAAKGLRLQQDMLAVARALQISGSQHGRDLGARAYKNVLAWRQEEIKSNLETLKGKPLTPEETKTVETIYEKGTKAAEELDKVTPVTPTDVGTELDTIKNVSDTPEVKAGTDDVRKAVGGKMPDSIKPKVQQSITEITGQLNDKVTSTSTNDPALKKAVKDLFAALVAEDPTRSAETLTDLMHGQLQEIYPEIDQQTVRKLVTSYGEYQPLSKDELDVRVREKRAQVLEYAKLQDLLEGKAPKRTGRERAKPTEDVKAVQKQIRDAIKSGKYESSDPNVELDSTKWVASEIAAANKKIDALNQRIQEGDFTPLNRGGRKSTPTEQLLQAREKLTATRKDYLSQKNEAAGFGRDLQKIDELQQHLRNGTLPLSSTKNPKIGKRAVTEEAIKNLRRQITSSEPAVADRLTARLDRLHEKLKNVDYQPPKDPPPDTPRIARLRANIWAAERDLRMAEQQVRPKSMWEQAQGVNNFLKGEAVNFGFHGVGRTGLLATLGHPALAAKVFYDTLKACRSDAAAAEHFGKLWNDPQTPMMLKAGLKLEFSGRNEFGGSAKNFLDKVLEYVPGIGKPMSWVRQAMRRNFPLFNTAMRMEHFKAMSDTLARNGTPTLDEAKQIAKFVNVSTGATTMQPGEIGKIASMAFLAPGYHISRFQWLMGQPAWKGPARGLVLREYGRQIAGLGVMAGAGGILGHVGINLGNSGFGKWIVGNDTIDPFGGLAQTMRFAGNTARYGIETAKRMIGVSDRSAGAQAHEAGAYYSSWLNSKWSPALQIAGHTVTGMTGPKAEANLSELPKALVPYTVRDLYDQAQKEGVGPVAARLPLLIMGASSYAYDRPPDAPKPVTAATWRTATMNAGTAKSMAAQKSAQERIRAATPK